MAVARHAISPLEAVPDLLDFTVAPSARLTSYAATLFKKVRGEKESDFILCGHINLMPVAWFLSKCLRVPIQLQIHGIEAWQPTARRITNRLVGTARVVTAVSQFTRKKFLRWAPVPEQNCFLVPNAITASGFGIGTPDPAFLNRYSLKNRRVILTFGRLVSKERAKGFDEVLDLMPELIRQVPNLIYVAAGEGPDRARLMSKADQLGILDHVVFPGFVEEREKADLYNAANVYVMPSKGEGFGFVFLEAMAHGIPVIASNQDGGQEAVGGGELGQVVNPDDPQEILSAILTALHLPKRVPPGLGRFSHENFTQNVFRVVDRIVEAPESGLP